MAYKCISAKSDTVFFCGSWKTHYFICEKEQWILCCLVKKIKKIFPKSRVPVQWQDYLSFIKWH